MNALDIMPIADSGRPLCRRLCFGARLFTGQKKKREIPSCNNVLVFAALLPLSVIAQTAPPQSSLQIWVTEDGTRGFTFRVAFTGDIEASEAEKTTRTTLQFMLAEKPWCLNGWSVSGPEIAPTERPKSVVVTLGGVCR